MPTTGVKCKEAWSSWGSRVWGCPGPACGPALTPQGPRTMDGGGPAGRCRASWALLPACTPGAPVTGSESAVPSRGGTAFCVHPAVAQAASPPS